MKLNNFLMRYLSILILLILGLNCYSQDYSSSSKKAIKNFVKARDYFMHQQDAEAEIYLLKAVDADKDFVEAWFMLAQIYLDKDQTKKAIDYYTKGLEVNPDAFPAGFLKVADLEYSIGKYPEASEHLLKWKNYGISDDASQKKAAALKRNLDFSLWAIENPVPFNPVSLGPAVNTEQFEYWPSLSIDEKTIYFTVLGPPNPDLPPRELTMQEDFYFAQNDEGRWVNRTYLGAPVNTNNNEGAQSITADGKMIFFTACNRPDGHGRMCDLYYSEVLENGRWSAPKNLGDVINTGASEKHPSISPDGRVLYFASNRGGGKGNYDIWMSVKVGNSWTEPRNLGDSINTPGIEQSPFLHPDQKTLYFSSDGWPGLGKGDIFLSRMNEKGDWTKAKNLGYPINTFNEEIGLIVNASGTKAFYASNRREGSDTDIFSFEIPNEIRPDPVSYISGRVYDARTMKGIAARFQLIDLLSGNLAFESESRSGEGDYFISLPSGSSYAFNVSQPGYLFYSDHFALEKSYSKLHPFRKEIPLEPIKEGKRIVLNNVFYDTDAFTLKPESKIELEKVYDFLTLNKNVQVEISGYTDNTGTNNYNMELSRRRAEEVVNYLLSLGIDPARLKAKGYGATVPVGDNTTEEGRALNRRTELKIL